MEKYIIVRTYCNNEKVAKKIIESLLTQMLVSGSQLSEVQSKYWWNNEFEECKEYKLEFRSKLSLFEEIKQEILKIHDYETAEVSYSIIDGANKEIFDWIEKNTKNRKR